MLGVDGPVQDARRSICPAMLRTKQKMTTAMQIHI